MRTLRTYSTLAFLALLSAPAFPGDRGSMEDQIACTPDVYRLCSQYIPDEGAITSCLRQHLPTLSAGCHKVFAPLPNGSAQDNDDD